MSAGGWFFTLAVALGPPSGLAGEVPHSRPASLPADLEPYIERLPAGRIDWSEGLLWIEGTSRTRGGTPQQRLMAQRGAEVIASRNALAGALGIQLDPQRRVGGYRSADIHIQGRVRGAATTRVTFGPGTCTASICVPLWGVEGIGRLYWRPQQVRLAYEGGPRILLPARDDDSPRSTKVTILIDARVGRVTASLYPEIVDTTGRRVHDLASLPERIAAASPPARFARVADPLNDLQGSGRIVVRAFESSERRLMISVEDADALANDPLAAAALRRGRVWIIVSPPDAGSAQFK